MNIVIELDEDTSVRLYEEAARRGMDAGDLGRDFLRQELSKTFVLDERPTKLHEETEMEFFDRMVREIEAISRLANPPALSDEAVTRAGIYAGHD